MESSRRRFAFGFAALVAAIVPASMVWACVAPVSLTGPVLTTVTGQPGGMSAKWEWDVPIPANTPYGKYYLYAVQNYRNMNAVIPKTVIYVGTVPDPAPEPEVRAASMDVGSGPSGVTLALLGLGAAAGGLLLVGAWTLLAGAKREGGPQPERVKAT
jgi:hypothetical protein